MRALLRRFHQPIYEHRLRVLVQLISPHLKPGMRVLDIGCGFGHLGRALMNANPAVEVEGVEKVRRGAELIPVTAHDGPRLPFADGAFDAAIVADVLHHDLQPQRLLEEAARVSGKFVIVKDHLREGLFAQERISLLDWAANAGYGVPCTYRYNSLDEWREAAAAMGGELLEERTSIDIYPPLFNELLGRSLHYFAVIGVPSGPAGTTN